MRYAHKLQIRQCTFQIQILQGSANVKFPCNFFIQWKTSNNKHSIISLNRHKSINGKITFNQKLQLTTHMVFDLNSQLYNKKQSIIMLNLVSNSRPNDPKLVGRVVVELSKVANSTTYQNHQLYHLQYCSVQGTITFRIVLKQEVTTDISPSQMQKSQLSQFQMAGSPKGSSRVDVKDETRSVGGFIVNRPVKDTKDNIKEGMTTSKLSQSKFQERINKLKAETESLKNSQLTEGIRYKTQTASQSQVIKDEPILPPTQIQPKRLKLSIPIFQKQAKQFDSGNKTNQKQEQIIKNNFQPISHFKKQPLILKHKKQQSKLPSLQNNTDQSKQQLQQQLTLKITKLQQELTSKNQLIQTISQQNRVLKIDQNILQNKIQSLNLNIQDLVAQNSLHNKQKFKLQDEVFKLNQELAQTYQNYKERNHLLQLERKKLEEQLYKKTQTKVVVPETIVVEESQSQELKLLKIQVQELKDVLLEKDLRIQFLQDQISTKLKLQSAQTHIPPQNLHIPPQTTHTPPEQNLKKDESQLQNLKHLLQTQQINHRNTKFQLQDLRQWLDEIQTHHQQLKQQNTALILQLQQANDQLSKIDTPLPQDQDKIMKDQYLQLELRQVKQQLIRVDGQLIQRQQELSGLKELLKVHQRTQANLIQQNNRSKDLLAQKSAELQRFTLQNAQNQDQQVLFLKNQISLSKKQVQQFKKQAQQSKKQIQLLKNQIQSSKRYIQQSKQQIQQSKKQIFNLQKRCVQQSSSIDLLKSQIQSLKTTLKQSQKQKKSYQSDLKKKDQQIQNQLKRFNDLIRRIKDKQQQIAKLQRQKQNSDLLIKQNAFILDQNKQKIKKIQTQRLIQSQKTKQLQKKYNISRQTNLKHQNQLLTIIQQSLSLKQKLQTQTKTNQYLQKLLNQTTSPKKSDKNIDLLQSNIKNIQEQLYKHIQRQQYYIQRQSILKQNLSIVQYQSQKIQNILKQKQETQEKLIENIIILSRDIGFLKNKIDELQKQLTIQNQRNQGLQIELQLLNAYQDTDNKTEMEEINRRLIQKNKQLLVELQEKNKQISFKEMEFVTFKEIQMKQIISQSRLKKQKEYYQNLQSSLKKQLQQLSLKNNQQFEIINEYLQKQQYFTSKNNELQSYLLIQKQKNQQLLKQKQNLSELINTKNQKYQKQIFQKIKNSNTSVGNLQKTVQKLQKDKKQLQDKLLKLKQQNKLIKSDCNDYLLQIKAYQNKVIEQQYKIKEFTIQIKQISQFNNNKELEVQKLNEEVASYQGEMERFNQEFNMKEFQIHMIKERVIELEGVLEQKDQEIRQKDEKLQRKDEEFMSKANNIQLQLQNNQTHPLIEKPIPSDGSQSQNVEQISPAILQEFEQVRIKLQSTIFELQTHIQAMKQKQSLLQTQIISLSEQLLTLKYSLQQQSQKSQSLQNQLSILKNSQTLNSHTLSQLKQKQYKLNMNILQYKQHELHLNNQIIASQTIIRKLNNQLDNLRSNLNNQIESQHSTPINKFKLSRVSQYNQRQESELFNVVQEFKEVLIRRRDNQDVENVMRLVMDTNSRQFQDMEKWNRQRGIIQEKAKLSSKQLQKLKSNIMKMPNRTIAQKSQLTNLLKPTQIAVNELIRLSQALSQMNLFEQPQEQFDQNA